MSIEPPLISSGRWNWPTLARMPDISPLVIDSTRANRDEGAAAAAGAIILSPDFSLMAERFDKPVADLFKMQDEIVSREASGVDFPKGEPPQLKMGVVRRTTWNPPSCKCHRAACSARDIRDGYPSEPIRIDARKGNGV